eukprot:CAMPEP_0194117480 /NCGR_PEP_ID=MMETSP0150-20130528/31434_1 /TAXON_ID=122233 /ORGANISM="Chaetoceros debilis, Strain MM31A-1" /LENGTH=845 /DNA_ID=CAMNT_0038808491 /DNA_START=69 /DNA_END=2606 /DNA_ORIENTATION=+
MAFKIFSVGNAATLLMVFYLYASMKGVYNLMNPLHSIDMTSFSAKDLVKPYWKKHKHKRHTAGSQENNGNMPMGMKVYMSTNPQFNADYIIDEFQQKARASSSSSINSNSEEELPRKRNPSHDSILLWDEPYVSSASLSKSFILTSDDENDETSPSESFQFATDWLDSADEKEKALEGGGGVTAVLSSAGDGIESTSVLLSLYKAVGDGISKLLGSNEEALDDENSAKNDNDNSNGNSRVIVPISKSSSIWKSIINNSTVNIQVVLLRNGREDTTFQSTMNNIMKDQQSHDLLVDGVDMIKFDPPYHINKPARYLYKDIAYIIQRYILRMVGEEVPKPWDMSKTKPEDFNIYEQSLEMKESGTGYPYWKPEVAVKLVSEEDEYPIDFVGYSQMEVIQVGKGQGKGQGQDNSFESGYAYLPGLYVDEMGLTSEKYIPLNNTVSALPLRISFHSNDNDNDDDNDDESSDSKSADGGLSPGRWRLLKHLGSSLESQKDFGFEQSDIDDVRRLVADTNVALLGVTVMASALHMLFEFLTFKTDVEFWKGNTDLTGLSVRALYMDFFSQTVILLYLIEKDSSLLMTIPAACGCLIALWKCQRGAGLKFVKVKVVTAGGGRKGNVNISPWNKFFRLFGYELQATRLRAAADLGDTSESESENEKKDSNSGSGSSSLSSSNNKKKNLAALSEEMDQLASRMLGKYLMGPLVLGYTAYTLINEEHSGWYSWFITSASSAVYGLGFVFMTPQLFLNYKLKSVAHLPWKVLGYRFVNTFIDDLFAFIIRMPTMARISCFRDDIVFIIYLWQRYLYPVDASRPVEGGGMDAVSAAAQTAVIDEDDEDDQKERKKNQ